MIFFIGQYIEHVFLWSDINYFLSYFLSKRRIIDVAFLFHSWNCRIVHCCNGFKMNCMEIITTLSDRTTATNNWSLKHWKTIHKVNAPRKNIGNLTVPTKSSNKNRLTFLQCLFSSEPKILFLLQFFSTQSSTPQHKIKMLRLM